MAGVSTTGQSVLQGLMWWEARATARGLQDYKASLPLPPESRKVACHLKRKTVVRNTRWNASLIRQSYRLQKPCFDAVAYSSSLSSLSVFLTSTAPQPDPAHPQPQGTLFFLEDSVPLAAHPQADFQLRQARLSLFPAPLTVPAEGDFQPGCPLAFLFHSKTIPQNSPSDFS